MGQVDPARQHPMSSAATPQATSRSDGPLGRVAAFAKVVERGVWGEGVHGVLRGGRSGHSGFQTMALHRRSRKRT